MRITWIGHSCFKIESNGYTLILDPYEDGYVPGLKPLRESADMVLCSHEHGDHNAKDLIEMQNEVKQVSIHANLLTYAAEIVDMTRNKAEIACGASPRAFLSMLRCAQALACMDERTYCIPEDIAESASLTIPHRLILTNGAKLSRITKEDLVKTILGQVKVQ